MKKLLLTLGAVASVAAPVAAVVACGTADGGNSSEQRGKIEELSTGWEVQLHNLGNPATVPATPAFDYPTRYSEKSLTTLKEKLDFLFDEGLIVEAQKGWSQTQLDSKITFNLTEITPTNKAYVLADGTNVSADVRDEYYFSSLTELVAELKIKTENHFYKANKLSDSDVSALLAPFASELSA